MRRNILEIITVSKQYSNDLQQFLDVLRPHMENLSGHSPKQQHSLYTKLHYAHESASLGS